MRRRGGGGPQRRGPAGLRGGPAGGPGAAAGPRLPPLHPLPGRQGRPAGPASQSALRPPAVGRARPGGGPGPGPHRRLLLRHPPGRAGGTGPGGPGGLGGTAEHGGVERRPPADVHRPGGAHGVGRLSGGELPPLPPGRGRRHPGDQSGLGRGGAAGGKRDRGRAHGHPPGARHGPQRHGGRGHGDAGGLPGLGQRQRLHRRDPDHRGRGGGPLHHAPVRGRGDRRPGVPPPDRGGPGGGGHCRGGQPDHRPGPSGGVRLRRYLLLRLVPPVRAPVRVHRGVDQRERLPGPAGPPAPGGPRRHGHPAGDPLRRAPGARRAQLLPDRRGHRRLHLGGVPVLQAPPGDGPGHPGGGLAGHRRRLLPGPAGRAAVLDPGYDGDRPGLPGDPGL